MPARSGSVGILDGSLDYRGEILLTEKISGDLQSQSGLVSGLVGLLEEEKSGRVKVPFKLKGTYRKPEFSLDFSPQEKAKEKIGKAQKISLYGINQHEKINSTNKK